MLYRLNSENDRFTGLAPMQYTDFSHHGQLEKDLENLMSGSLMEVLFEEAPLLPVCQERSWQAEADIYALNEVGELVLFELKRGAAGENAVHQALGYAQQAAQWSFAELERRFQQYKEATQGLLPAHQEAFALEHPLTPREINARQQLYIVGSASDEDLRTSVAYWRRQGVAIEFLPYRIYDLGGNHYFEFFSPPFDQHRNPADQKGVIFDTNRSWDEDAIWYMFENCRVAAFGDAMHSVERLAAGDLVFLSHRWTGLVGAGRVRSGPAKLDGEETMYRDLEFLTPVPERSGSLRAMPFRRVSETTGRTFFWARTIKVPYLQLDEADVLLDQLQATLGSEQNRVLDED